MADETSERSDDTYADDAPEDVDEATRDDERLEPPGAPPGDDGYGYQEPAPELGRLNRDYMIPGVGSDETNPYRWHTGKKREHGGEDAIEVIDLVKQFGRTRILNGLNLGVPDNQISMVLNIVLVHIIGMLGTLIFWGANPRAPIGG